MMRRMFTTFSAAALLGIAALACGCVAPADVEEESPDEAELLGESSQAVCTLLDGYLPGKPASSFPDFEDPVVGYQLIHTVLQSDTWGSYFDYRIQFCNGSTSSIQVYNHYIFGPAAGLWLLPEPLYHPV